MLDDVTSSFVKFCKFRCYEFDHPVNARRKLNVLYTLNLGPVSTEQFFAIGAFLLTFRFDIISTINLSTLLILLSKFPSILPDKDLSAALMHKISSTIFTRLSKGLCEHLIFPTSVNQKFDRFSEILKRE